MGTVAQLYTTPNEGEPMESHESVEAVDGGLVGDRYLQGTGYYSPYDVCEITLLEAEAIETIHETFGIDLWDGRHRRNIVTRGVKLHDLLETTFRIGTVELRGTRPRPPCRHVEHVADEGGVARALGEDRGGICARVLSSGTITVGDSIEITEADPRTIGSEIADRLQSGVDTDSDSNGS
ncbi:MOSC domain-containing protein [Halohasta litchfieldiae]|jgi:MOSC domain-containing protein YiiM|uniref:MOSC domain-containing protein n=1 Tax=Halohasta litchfieldiae TaxID=1073996 RepID=A0A1H6TI36_9EURY|nr:MOSC domain-containing protein [Halohasta litchfieldiae]ATW87640.1 MOSC domain-containing protein [Halohasta litchfieldiae]SEI76807.1 MOSC domain-containing protein [Halohasta litchfieldiae]